MFANLSLRPLFKPVQILAEYIGVWACIYIAMVFFSIFYLPLESVLVSPYTFVVYFHYAAIGALLGLFASICELNLFAAIKFGMILVSMAVPLIALRWILTHFVNFMIGFVLQELLSTSGGN